MILLSTLNIFTCFSSFFVVEFKQVNDSYEPDLLNIKEIKTKISCQQTYLFNHSSKQLVYLTCTAINVKQNNKFFMSQSLHSSHLMCVEKVKTN